MFRISLRGFLLELLNFHKYGFPKAPSPPTSCAQVRRCQDVSMAQNTWAQSAGPQPHSTHLQPLLPQGGWSGGCSGTKMPLALSCGSVPLPRAQLQQETQW